MCIPQRRAVSSPPRLTPWTHHFWVQATRVSLAQKAEWFVIGVPNLSLVALGHLSLLGAPEAERGPAERPHSTPAGPEQWRCPASRFKRCRGASGVVLIRAMNSTGHDYLHGETVTTLQGRVCYIQVAPRFESNFIQISKREVSNVHHRV